MVVHLPDVFWVFMLYVYTSQSVRRRAMMRADLEQPIQLDDFDDPNAAAVRNLYTDPVTRTSDRAGPGRGPSLLQLGPACRAGPGLRPGPGPPGRAKKRATGPRPAAGLFSIRGPELYCYCVRS